MNSFDNISVHLKKKNGTYNKKVLEGSKKLFMSVFQNDWMWRIDKQPLLALVSSRL